MKTQALFYLRTGLLALGLLVFLMSAGGALGVVWLRQQISLSADACTDLEKSLLQAQRRSTYLQSKIAEVHNPDYLKDNIGSKLSMPSKNQIVWVKDPNKCPAHRIAANLTRSKPLATAINNPVF